MSPKTQAAKVSATAASTLVFGVFVFAGLNSEDPDTVAVADSVESTTTTEELATTTTEKPTTTTTRPPTTTATTAAPTTTTTAAPPPPPTAPPPPPPPALMPAVVCMNLQDAQDLIQTTGVFFSRSFDATGQGRMQVLDSNWIVVSQDPPPGSPISEGSANLGVVKYGEPGSC